MNGQTGKIGGKLPTSAWKVVWIVLGILAFFAVIAAMMFCDAAEDITQYIDFDF